MAKPTKLPTWATGAAAIVEPSDGKKALGWIPGEQPPAAFYNYWQNLVHQWIEWFDGNAAIDATVGDLLVNGALATTGNATVGSDGTGNLQVNGTLAATGAATVAALTSTGLATIGGNLDLAGNATVGSDGTGNLQVNGTLGATGAATLGGNVDVAGNATVGSDGTGNLQVNGTLGTTGDATIGSDGSGSLTVNGSATVGSLSSTGDATIGSDGSGNLIVNGTVTTTGLTTVGGNLDVNGNADVLGGDFRVLAGDCEVSGLYVYNTLPSRTKLINLFHAIGSITVATGGDFRVLSSVGGADPIEWPIDLPTGAVLSTIEVMGHADSVSNFELWKRHGHNWSTGAAPTVGVVVPAVLTPGGSVDFVVTLTAGFTINNATEEYFLVWYPGATNSVTGIRVTFTDPGPRNH